MPINARKNCLLILVESAEEEDAERITVAVLQ
jgi:hypothetical protein